MLFGNYEEIREPQYLVLQEMSAMQSHRLVDELHNLQIHLLHTLEAPIFSAALIPMGNSLLGRLLEYVQFQSVSAIRS